MEYVFISYSVKDKDFVSRLNNDLNSKGINTWVDYQQINPGEMWKDSLETALKKANLIIVILSENSINSAYVMHEFIASRKNGKRIIPIKIDLPIGDKMPSYIMDIQWLDFTEDYQYAFNQLLQAIPESIVQDHPITTNKQKSKGYIFLSYAEEDGHHADELKTFLKNNQFAYWDYQSSDRNYHSQFFLELESVIEDAVATLSVITSYWRTSVWATREYFFSEEIGTPVYLLKFQQTKPILAISGQHYIDFINNKPLAFTKLSNELNRKGL